MELIFGLCLNRDLGILVVGGLSGLERGVCLRGGRGYEYFSNGDPELDILNPRIFWGRFALWPLHLACLCAATVIPAKVKVIFRGSFGRVLKNRSLPASRN
jgi:hypothetical protein